MDQILLSMKFMRSALFKRPTWVAATCPSLNRINVGIPRTPNWVE